MLESNILNNGNLLILSVCVCERERERERSVPNVAKIILAYRGNLHPHPANVTKLKSISNFSSALKC